MRAASQARRYAGKSRSRNQSCYETRHQTDTRRLEKRACRAGILSPKVQSEQMHEPTHEVPLVLPLSTGTRIRHGTAAAARAAEEALHHASHASHSTHNTYTRTAPATDKTRPQRQDGAASHWPSPGSRPHLVLPSSQRPCKVSAPLDWLHCRPGRVAVIWNQSAMRAPSPIGCARVCLDASWLPSECIKPSGTGPPSASPWPPHPGVGRHRNASQSYRRSKYVHTPRRLHKLNSVGLTPHSTAQKHVASTGLLAHS